MKTLFALLVITVAFRAAAPAQSSPPDVAVYNGVLQRFVNDRGEVNYAKLNSSIAPLDRYVRQLAQVSPHSHPGLFKNKESRLAYWINAYNALVLWAFAKDYPDDKDRLKGLLGRGLFFYRRKFEVGGKRYSLAHIENKIIRAEFQEPRIHFALVCASAGCPWLARDAYTAENLERMLDMRTRQFINQERNVAPGRSNGVLRVSKIFDWYKEDFGKNKDELRAYIARYRRGDADKIVGRKWRIEYAGYDWSLNEQAHGAADAN